MTEQERIKKEADEYVNKSRWMESWKTTESKLAYIAGANARLDQLKQRDETIQVLREAFKASVHYVEELDEMFQDTEQTEIRKELRAFINQSRKLIED